MSAATSSGSLSAKSALGLILVKSIYLLKDTEKLGLYILLITESLEALQSIYNVDGNPEFSELLHLCLFAFDSVTLTSLLICIGMRFLQGIDLRRSFNSAHPPSCPKFHRSSQLHSYYFN